MKAWVQARERHRVKPGTEPWKSVTGLGKLRRYLDGSAAKRRTSGNFFEPDTLAANPPPDRGGVGEEVKSAKTPSAQNTN